MAHDDLKVSERVVDAVVTWERVSYERFLQDGRHGHFGQARFHGPTALAARQVHPDVEAADEPAHQILAELDVV